ncbi:MAG: FliH/SctL family protein [Janthinobacterium lividum]
MNPNPLGRNQAAPGDLHQVILQDVPVAATARTLKRCWSAGAPLHAAHPSAAHSTARHPAGVPSVTVTIEAKRAGAAASNTAHEMGREARVEVQREVRHEARQEAKSEAKHEAKHEARQDPDHGAGLEAGDDADCETGCNTGHPPGFSAANRAGYEAGHEAGYESGRQAGFAAGREEGVQTGRLAGHAEGLARAQEAAQRDGERLAGLTALADARSNALAALLHTLRQQIPQLLEQAEDDIVSVCFEVLCQIIGSGSNTAVQVRNHVRATLAHAAQAQALQVHLHPHDLQLLRHGSGQETGGTQQEAQERDGFAGIEFIADPALVSGGCVVCGSDGALDARLDRQLDQVRGVLLRARGERQ